MHIHILGICGTFMGGVAILAKSLGYKVTGSDKNVYPPMSTQLEEQGIELIQGFDPSQLDSKPDLVVIGNAMSRGNACVEAVLDKQIPYISGPQWLLEHVLKDRWVLAVAGTHGKTSTSSMLAWILEYAHMQPGFLIGGVPENFGLSARLGETPFFVIEADEYDSAFFDKRSKFVHYHPRTLVLNNLEFDHADIFDDLNAIKKQFHHLVRTVPSSGRIILPNHDQALMSVKHMGCWSEVEYLDNSVGGNWSTEKVKLDGSQFEVFLNNEKQGQVNWPLMGDHNIANALGAIAAARHVGVTPEISIEALAEFKSIKRRMEVKGKVNNITVYDDFAHHPTAIKTTLAGLRAKVGNERIIAVLEPRSNTMKLGIHKEAIVSALNEADHVYCFEGDDLNWSMQEMFAEQGKDVDISTNINTLCDKLVKVSKANDHILIMSNGGFASIHQKLLDKL
ncbi:UDP-N-acetylmuramate:L-alanyl-gamma-D-glutamyl-meso-diaminopimelate ligase [Psychromonas sp. Urea-02u-13]|uniref:UDP-N-acetylmuramate:L-alanyl-gamma-D-glutamyl- meso-diaminopimelate ligase n=1 Tax=Psychromonas sp. Urea-02u-13 TaxID=2058326 RepID=UPI000C336E01|nr:UDP-N-acetylmuramate:L-alanyl-gamma-D-glutamyl-meso-diaminopimelate ligase [Psychromonas sp. Urea-02u-13]PKG37536.1 UDP-N-acetylmuramate:L-alanyl-gamma-D-glutamyl-meso-diaminopimelate ligase [Psychromonas sp. Urea-02u-13]